MSTTLIVATIKSNVANAFNRIGHNNGHAVPKEYKDANVIPLIHELMVAKQLESLSKKRCQEIKEAIFDMIELPNPGDGKVSVLTSDLYDVIAEVRNPSMSVTKAKLKVELIKAFNLSDEQADKFILQCSSKKAGQRLLDVVGKA